MLKYVFIVGLSRFFCLTLEQNCVKTSEDTSILSTMKMFTGDSSCWRYKVYADIGYGSGTRRRQL